MNLQQLIEKIEGKVLTTTKDREITCGFVCDLLSWVIANGQKGMAWVTLQTNMNVIAIAALHEIACVILPANITMPEEVLNKAIEENVVVISSPKNAFEICGILYEAGIR